MTTLRKLASIQRVLNVKPIEGADYIECLTVLGWQCVAKKGEFQKDDLVVFIEPDSILPERPEFEFMRPRNFKVRTVKLRKQISQGIVFPLSILPDDRGYSEDANVTEILGITKYEPELPQNLRGSSRSPYRYKYPQLPNWFYNAMRKVLPLSIFKKFLCVTSGAGFPSFIPKTDETRVQVLQGLLDKYQGTQCYITEKLDGSSITCYLKDGQFGVCSRNVDLKEEVGNTFWDTVRELGIEQKMRENIPKWRNFAIQGELIGEGIQQNKLKLTGHTIRFFNVFDIDIQKYADLNDFKEYIEQLKLPIVPVLNENFILTGDIDELVKLSIGKSVICPTAQREGIVIRPLFEQEETEEARGYLVRNRLSFKAINPEFLLKYQEA